MSRAKGSLNKATIAKQEQLKSALEICRDMEMSPPELMAKAIELIQKIALSPLSAAKSAKEEAALLLSLPEDTKRNMVQRLQAASSIAHDLMEFAYPKLARMEHTGLAGGPIEHKHEHSDATEFVRSRIARLAAREGTGENSSGTLN